ncbi:hypothetical protein, partial [Desulfonatronospira sp.]|uniref:hypothetical protein n=1 Tax=Desulfonatronospira sp. TaxID=1962951 RepID=UPI0025B9E432
MEVSSPEWNFWHGFSADFSPQITLLAECLFITQAQSVIIQLCLSSFFLFFAMIFYGHFLNNTLQIGFVFTGYLTRAEPATHIFSRKGAKIAKEDRIIFFICHSFLVTNEKA